MSESAGVVALRVAVAKGRDRVRQMHRNEWPEVWKAIDIILAEDEVEVDALFERLAQDAIDEPEDEAEAEVLPPADIQMDAAQAVYDPSFLQDNPDPKTWSYWFAAMIETYPEAVRDADVIETWFRTAMTASQASALNALFDQVGWEPEDDSPDPDVQIEVTMDAKDNIIAARSIEREEGEWDESVPPFPDTE